MIKFRPLICYQMTVFGRMINGLQTLIRFPFPTNTNEPNRRRRRRKNDHQNENFLMNIIPKQFSFTVLICLFKHFIYYIIIVHEIQIYIKLKAKNDAIIFHRYIYYYLGKFARKTKTSFHSIYK